MALHHWHRRMHTERCRLQGQGPRSLSWDRRGCRAEGKACSRATLGSICLRVHAHRLGNFPFRWTETSKGDWVTQPSKQKAKELSGLLLRVGVRDHPLLLSRLVIGPGTGTGTGHCLPITLCVSPL